MKLGIYTNFRIDQDDRGVVTAWLDVPDKPLNVLTESVMEELSTIVGSIERSQDVRLFILRSGKESGFLAGADVHVLANVTSVKRAGELVDAGQALFNRIEGLKIPTIAMIDGVCLGGGLELALACRYRIARDSSSTQLGLPEIKLGIIPGWGGTQRLPRRIGLSTALSMIMKGELIDAKKAGRIGLVDRVAEPQHWDVAVAEFVDEILGNDKLSNSNGRSKLWTKLLDNTYLGRRLVLRLAARSIERKQVHYPALRSALTAIKTGLRDPNAGLAQERNEFTSLLLTPTCRNLLDIFFARERARQIKTWTSSATAVVHESPIAKVGIIGAGAMGAGIGQLAAYRGFTVVLKEVNAEAAEAGRRRIEGLIDDLAIRKKWSVEERSDVRSRINITCEDDELMDADLIIEAVVEREDVKCKLFQSLDRFVYKSTILASNTSSLSVTKMANATMNARRVAGLHFFNPVHRMELVEIVKTNSTDDRTVARLATFTRALGKTPIVTTDSPGFLVNRVLFPYLGEAAMMVCEGYDIETIDREIRHFGMPMGPLELLDQVGIDVAFHVAGSLGTILVGLEPVVDFLGDMVKRGEIGKKADKGFYTYRNEKRRKATSFYHTVTSGQRFVLPELRVDGLTAIQRRLIYPMLVETMRCMQEHIVEHKWAADLAMVLGTGFAPHRGGPLHVIDSIGPNVLKSNLRHLESQFGKRFAAPALLDSMAEGNARFFDSNPIATEASQLIQH